MVSKGTKKESFIIKHLSDLEWAGYIDNALICEFRYYMDDNGKIWINNIATDGNFQEKGFGTRMIIAALEVYKEIYVSTAERWEIEAKRKFSDKIRDERYSVDGRLWPFINKLVERDILKQEWLKKPFV